MISYKELKYKTTPVDFHEIDFEILEQHLNIRIDDFTRECVRKSDHLRRILAFRKFESSQKNSNITFLDGIED
ncbi:B9T54_RS14040 family protein [Leptospira alstonii]|uniref:Uncharacterized protein n=2 Tax=Leptospira alstonii TaxID=28452 RepID=M6CYW9_9LEPT|nr:hypothetical protein [Leptospira alstonii]EMJ95706.1 hypothetical protein LEP1GSC194_2362 [Leptospira alstonii serovar Sichuan str. 79601]EQA80617.1 hypothetical protein LEP1GSC193_3843 [Leptospira alstonii serovar Pingchang str. 80-412]